MGGMPLYASVCVAAALNIGRDADGSDAAFAKRSAVAHANDHQGGWQLTGEGSHHPEGHVTAHGTGQQHGPGMMTGGGGGGGGHHRHGKRAELRPSARAAAQFAAVCDASHLWPPTQHHPCSVGFCEPQVSKSLQLASCKRAALSVEKMPKNSLALDRHVGCDLFTLFSSVSYLVSSWNS